MDKQAILRAVKNLLNNCLGGVIGGLIVAYSLGQIQTDFSLGVFFFAAAVVIAIEIRFPDKKK